MSLATDGYEADVSAGMLDLDWGFWDAQLEAIDAIDSGEYDLVVFRGGYGSGKTVLGSRQLIEKALAIPKSDNLILAQDSQKGGPTTYKVFFEQLPGADTVPDTGGDPENSPIVADYNINKSRLTLINGAVIRLGSADVWNRYAGGEFNFIWADEVAHYETTDLFQLNRMLISRQRTEAGPNVCLWTSTGNGYNQFHTFVEVQETPDGDPLPTRIENVVADSRNNPFLAEKAKLKRQFEGTPSEEQGLAGGFAAAEGRVYSTFSRPRHVRPLADIEPALVDDWRLYGYDHGWDDPRVVVEFGKTNYGQLVVLDLFYRSETSIEVAVNWLAENDKPRGVIHCEHEPEHIVKFRQAGYPAAKAEKDLDLGIPIVRDRLALDDADRPGLLIADTDACSPAIKELQTYKQDDVGKQGAKDHFLDASRYAIVGNTLLEDQTTGTDDGDGGIRTF